MKPAVRGPALSGDCGIWGYDCAVIAPSLIPKRARVQRKHDKRDAVELARLYRAGELVAVRIPSEAAGRVRDVVRCRETFQREILCGTTCSRLWRGAASADSFTPVATHQPAGTRVRMLV